MPGLKTILYLHGAKNPVKHRRILDGMRRFARSVGLAIEEDLIDEASPVPIGVLLRRHRAVGCFHDAIGDAPGRTPTRVGAFPVVWLDPNTASARRTALSVVCDNAAVAQAAFRELSAGSPPAFAVVPYWDPWRRWARERVSAFRAICAKAGRRCLAFPAHGIEAPETRAARLAAWVSTLPLHCAIFGVNDFTAHETAKALLSRHRAIPRTATLVGVDGGDERHDVATSPIPISSVQINFERAGFLAAQKIWNALAARNVKPARNDSGSHAPGKDDGESLFGPLLVVRRQSTGGRGRHEPYILEAVEAIRREAGDGLTAAALATRYPCSRKHFERRFREATGHSVLDEILHVRLEQVLAYLARRDVAIDTIAGLCGFGSEIELRRLFRRRFGMSMTEWRARNSL